MFHRYSPKKDFRCCETFLSPKLQGKDRHGKIQVSNANDGDVNDYYGYNHPSVLEQMQSCDPIQPMRIQYSYNHNQINSNNNMCSKHPLNNNININCKAFNNDNNNDDDDDDNNYSNNKFIHSHSLSNISMTDADKLMAERIYHKNNTHQQQQQQQYCSNPYDNNTNLSNIHLQDNELLSNQQFSSPALHKGFKSFNQNAGFSSHDQKFHSTPLVNYNEPLPLSSTLSSSSSSWMKRHDKLMMMKNQTSPSSVMPPPLLPSSSSSSNHVDIVQKIADDIIRKKDEIIISQRHRIEELESQSIGSTSNLLMEVQQENEFLKQQLNNNHQHNKSMNKSFSSSAMLDKQLCALEYELSQLKMSKRMESESKKEEITKLEKEISDKNDELKTMQDKLNRQQQQIQQLLHEQDQNMKYMSGLPSVEDHKHNLDETKKLKQQSKEKDDSIKDLNEKLSSVTNELKMRSDEYEANVKRMNEVKIQCNKLQEQNKRLSDELNQRTDLHDMRMMKKDVERIYKQAEADKKIYESKLKQLNDKLTMERKENEEIKMRMNEDGNIVGMLREDVANKEEMLRVLREKCNKVSEGNRQLQDEMDRLNELMKRDAGMKSDYERRITQQLMDELNWCAEDLKVIIGIIKDKGEGKEVGVEALLGISNPPMKSKTTTTSSSSSSSTTSSSSCLDRLKEMMVTMKTMRRDVDVLRGELADVMAEEMGRRLTCNHQ